jgi:tetratricopeptide (TPR) repeat protein
MRLDLGVLQMELDGRPDGKQPFGVGSLLEYHEARARQQTAGSGTYALEPADCEALMREAIQFYHRYVALFHLGRYDLVTRDTERNLRLFAFVRAHATRDRDKFSFDQYRPYVTMMRARALAHQALDRSDHRTAIDVLDQAICSIKGFFREYDQQEQLNSSQELILLRKLRREIDRERRTDPVERLDDQLQLAIAREDYEEAARIRDQIRRLRIASSLNPSDRSPAS